MRPKNDYGIHLGRNLPRSDSSEIPHPAPVRCVWEAGRIDSGSDSRLTVQLTNEHREISRDLERLRARARESEIAQSSRIMYFNQLAESISDHFRKEEQFLFPVLDRALGSAICDRLRGEHAEITSIAKKLSQETRLPEESFSKLEELFRAHTSTEENVLFWYLDLKQPTEASSRAYGSCDLSGRVL